MNFTTSDGISLRYTDTGLTNKPVIVGIPGIGGTLCMWEKLVSLLKDDFRIILYDPRNQGHSQRTYQGQRIARHGADLKELIDCLGLKKVIGIGNSMGAAIIWSCVSLFGSSDFQAIISLDQSPKMITDAHWQYGFKELTWENFPEYMKIDFGQSFYAHIDDEMFAKAVQDQREYPYSAADNYACLINHAQEDWRDVLISCSLPQLVLAGKNSPFFDYHFTTAIKQLNEHIETQVIPDCGHLIQAEQPKRLAAIIRRFLGKRHN